MKRALFVVAWVVVCALPAAAQPPAPTADPVSKALKASFDTVAGYLARSAEKMPEENFAFKPTPEVRSFGEILGHVANSHYAMCSRFKGEKNPSQGIDLEKKTSKADIVKALNESIAYCGEAYSGMTDAKALEVMPPPPGMAPPPQASPALRLRPMLNTITHDQEHYGNLVTYLRMKGLVPPSSEPRK